MKKIRIILSYEFIQDNPNINPYRILLDRIIKTGYHCLDGRFGNTKCIKTMSMKFIYYLGKRDILFKQFKRWKPEWEKRKEILFRKF